MDVHPTKNVSIGIDPYPYIKIYKIPHWIWPSSFPSVPLSGEPKPPLRLRPVPESRLQKSLPQVVRWCRKQSHDSPTHWQRLMSDFLGWGKNYKKKLTWFTWLILTSLKRFRGEDDVHLFESIFGEIFKRKVTMTNSLPWKITIFNRQTSINGPFPMAMLVIARG